MAGNKNSGRKSWDKEIQAKELWNLSIPVLKHALTSKKKELQSKKIDIALALVNKMLPNEIKGEVNTYVKIWTTIVEKEKGIDDFGRLRNQVDLSKV